jgi:hypothetical protein
MSAKRVALLIVFVIGLMFVAGLVLWRGGYLSLSSTAGSGNVVAAALTLIGALLAASISLVGILFKESYDRRSEDRARTESDRADAAGREAEKRLQLEAAIKAIQLFAKPDGSESLPIQRAGALFMLSSLSHHELALALASELLRDKGVGPNVVATVVDDALRSKDKRAEEQAITFLYASAGQMLTEPGFDFPSVLLNGSDGLPRYVREWSAIALATLILARPLLIWREQLFDAYGALAGLALMWLNEEDVELKQDLSAMLNAVLRAFPDLENLRHPARFIDITLIRTAVAGTQPFTTGAADVVIKFEKWLIDGSAASIPAGQNPPVVAPARNDATVPPPAASPLPTSSQ